MSRGAPKAPITYQGEYDATRSYVPLKIVTHDGSVYLSVASSTGSIPNPGSATPWLPIGGGGMGVLFARDRFVLTGSGAVTKDLTFTPLADSAHVYLNGLAQDEGVDYTISGSTLNVLAATGSASGDLLDVRYAYTSGPTAVGSTGIPYRYTATLDGTTVVTWSDTGAIAGAVSGQVSVRVESDEGYAISGYLDNLRASGFLDDGARSDGPIGNGWSAMVDTDAEFQIASGHFVTLDNPGGTGTVGADSWYTGNSRVIGGVPLSVGVDVTVTGADLGPYVAVWLHFGDNTTGAALSIDSGGGWKIWSFGTTQAVEASGSGGVAGTILFTREAL